MRRSAVLSVPVLAALMVPVAALGAGTSDWIDGFRPDVQRCWNPPEGSAVVTVTFGMNRDGTVKDDTLRSIPREMADTDSFTAARRAILRCSRMAFDLPADQYDAWRNIEMTFGPAVEGEQ